MKRFVAPWLLGVGIALTVTACSDPYNPNQRAVGGGLLGAGAGAAIGGLAGGGVYVVGDSGDYRWSDLVAAADLVVLGNSSGTATLLNVLAAGRPVVAAADAMTVQLGVPAIVGLIYQPGDVSGMAEALLRLATTPVLRRGMGGRARQVARRHHLENPRAESLR